MSTAREELVANEPPPRAGDVDSVEARATDVLEEVDRLIRALEVHADPAVGEQLRALLDAIDAVHRTALTHLIDAIRGMAGDAFINRLAADPAVRLLLMSYDLLAVDRRILAEEALDQVRGHLHVHGIDIELQDVVGGAVYVRLHGLERSGIDPELVRHDLEAALSSGLIGFQQLELHERAPGAGELVSLGGIRRAQRPVFSRVAALDDVPAGTIRAVTAGDVPILLANVDGEIYAVRNRCGETPLPLEFSTLEGDGLRCSWHGCRWDVRSGRRVDGKGGEERVQVYPVAVSEDGEIRVAIGVEPHGAETSGTAQSGSAVGSETDC